MTSNQNPVSNITTQELLEIYSGNRTTWSNGDRLRLILRPESDADTELLKGMSPEMERAVKSALSREGMKMAVTDQDSADAVEQTPGGFGVSSLPLIIAEKRSLKALSVNGVIPSGKTIAEGSYPWFKTYYVLTKVELAAPSKQFIDFLFSPRAKKILLSSGYWLPDVKGNQ
jgi:phosphate transport system substrate-binding protein